ncbi:MAG: hypothetical protein GY866_21575 [Proteobacteria bacterium]|nr:hypothetical protein [Pseudomonadota bacterium]
MILKLLKAEFCRFEEAFKSLRVRIKIENEYVEAPTGTDNQVSAKITNNLGMEYDLATWAETITDTTEKLVKEFDLNGVTFLDGKLQLTVGTHTLEISIGSFTKSITFKVVPISVKRLRDQYLLGINLEANATLVLQQPLKRITGVEVEEVSNDTRVGVKELVWDATDKTLSYDNGEPVEIIDDQEEYIIQNFMSTAAGDGDYLTITVEDFDELPEVHVTESVVIDTKNFLLADFQKWIETAWSYVTATVINTGIEPIYYSSDESEKAAYLDPVDLLPKNYSRTRNMTFEFPVNLLKHVVELWAVHFTNNSSKINISTERVKSKRDGTVSVLSFPFHGTTVGNLATLGLAGMFDKTIYANSHHGARNPVKNFWHGKVVAGIDEEDLRNTAIDVIAKIATIGILNIAGSAKDAGVSSTSFSVSGISASKTLTSSAMYGIYSAPIDMIQKSLGVGNSTKDEVKNGLITILKRKVEGGGMSFKY